MASKSDSRRVSANVAVFIISFLVFTTLIVFAVLLFLSYENMLRMLSYEVTHGTRTAAQGLAIDIETVTGSYDNEFVYTVDNDGIDTLEAEDGGGKPVVGADEILPLVFHHHKRMVL